MATDGLELRRLLQSSCRLQSQSVHIAFYQDIVATFAELCKVAPSTVSARVSFDKMLHISNCTIRELVEEPSLHVAGAVRTPILDCFSGVDGLDMPSRVGRRLIPAR